ncbi:N-acetylglucosamine-6-phosphate deacetylase [soil metagenome]
MTRVSGRLVLPEAVVPGHILVKDGRITSLEEDPGAAGGSFILPGFIDVHVHGWGGHDAMGGPAALTGMARALAARGVTSFLPTAVTASLERLAGFADSVRQWLPRAPGDGAEPLGFNLEGPFLSEARKGAHDPAFLRGPAEADEAELSPLLDGLRVITVAPELPGALALIERLAGRGVCVSLGHSAATLAQARAGYAAGARSTTHLFNAMTGVSHRDPGLAVAALVEDDAYAELIADGYHVDSGLWPLIWRAKPSDRLLLVSDAISLAGSGRSRGRLGTLDIEVADGRARLSDGTLAGSIIALDTAVRKMVAAGAGLVEASLAASTNPAALLGRGDRGRLEVGLRADLVELDGSLEVRRVMRGGEWLPAGQAGGSA